MKPTTYTHVPLKTLLTRFSLLARRCNLAAAITLSVLAGTALADQQASVSVALKGLQNDKGQVQIALFYGADNYAAGKQVAASSQSIIDGKAQVVFQNLAPGEYAIQAFHDEDGDGQLNTNALGMPVEAYAFSSGAKGMFGPPKFKAAKFLVENAQSQHTITFH